MKNAFSHFEVHNPKREPKDRDRITVKPDGKTTYRPHEGDIAKRDYDVARLIPRFNRVS